ncbi:MAG: M20 family metallopeptidase [Gemmatimonadetes bacterium]|nr:M20 family metallopeptidase [Gemmatimonadota bacterium]
MSEDLLSEAATLQDEYLSLLKEAVERESPSGDVERIQEVASFFASQFEARGAEVALIEAPGAGVHLLARIPGEESGGKPLLVLGHMDTVHPVGTFGETPFTIDGDKVRGPGVYDMKGGIVAILMGMDLLARRGEKPAGDILVLATCDEEVGSATSRSLIEEKASEARGCVVMEPCVPGGAAKVRRKGGGQYRLTVEGIAVHAGIEPEKGASAIHELARQIIGLEDLADKELGTTVNVGVVEGGTKVNVVADRAVGRIDVRFWNREEAHRMDDAIRGVTPADPRCSLTVEGEINRYAMEKTPASDVLFQVAKEEADKIGFTLEAGESGGASDGNFTSGIGCPTVDGMGIDGGGAHALDEHILLADIPTRIALASRLLARL